MLSQNCIYLQVIVVMLFTDVAVLIFRPGLGFKLNIKAFLPLLTSHPAVPGKIYHVRPCIGHRFFRIFTSLEKNYLVSVKDERT